MTILVDNYIDMFVTPTTDQDQRPPFSWTRPLRVEHGLSCLIRAFADGEVHEVLMDTGLSAGCMLHNTRQLDCPLDGVEAVVLSHGHFDHIGGLNAFFQEAGRPVPLDLPQLDAATLKEAGADLQLYRGLSTLAAGHLLVTGEVERTMSFERGRLGMEAFTDGRWAPDPINDDQAVVINVKDKGLVVISGCAHAWIINTVKYAQKITGINHIHAVLGGFHLIGPLLSRSSSRPSTR